VHGMPTWAAHTLTSNTSFVSIAGKGSAHDRRLARSVRSRGGAPSVCGSSAGRSPRSWNDRSQESSTRLSSPRHPVPAAGC